MSVRVWLCTTTWLLVSAAQASAAQNLPGRQDQALRLFLDCQVDCDIEFLRIELPWVNHVRDRADADVHVLVTGQQTGAGGQQVTLQFIGLRTNEGQKNELVYNGEPNEALDARRRGMLRAIRLGLCRTR